MNLWPILVTVFFAELGDKTQLATVLFAASTGALVLASVIDVLVRSQLSDYLPHRALKLALAWVSLPLAFEISSTQEPD